MPLEPHEELKLSWELKWLEVQVDRALDDREKIRQDINESRLRMDESRLRMDKFMRDQTMDDKRFKVQVWRVVCTGAGVVVAAFAAGAAWMKFFS